MNLPVPPFGTLRPTLRRWSWSRPAQVPANPALVGAAPRLTNLETLTLTRL